MAEKATLTDRKIKSLKAAPEGKREQVMDLLVPGFGVRVTDKGIKTYIFQARYPGSSNPSRRELGKVGVLTLEEARKKAREWHALIKRGLDPLVVERREHEANLRNSNLTFEAVFEDYRDRKLAKLKSGKRTEDRYRSRILRHFDERSITEITDLDVLSRLINPLIKRTPQMARLLLIDMRTFFRWVVDQRIYGLTVSPLDSLRVSKIAPKGNARQRVLSAVELRALWIAANRLPYPIGPFYRTLMLVPLRLREAANTSRREWNMRELCWTIPGERMKGKLPHAIPITEELKAIYAYFPNRGEFLFSHTGGEKPMSVANGNSKNIIEAEMLKALKEIALENGDDPEAVTMTPWTNHDIRRTVRSRLSGLKVPESAREALLAHVKGGVEAVYDVHDYFEEKREALEVWAAELRRIVEPPPDNIVSFPRKESNG